MKRKIARVAFWLFFLITLFFIYATVSFIIERSFYVSAEYRREMLAVNVVSIAITGILFRIYNPFKEKYLDVKETPLTFHVLFCYAVLPLGAIIKAISILQILSAADFPSNRYYFIDLGFQLASLLLMGFCFLGLREWNPFAGHLLMVHLLLGILYAVIVVVITARMNPYYVSTPMATLTFSTYSSAIIAIYYQKRKALFFSTASVHTRETPNEEIEVPTPISSSTPEISFCRECGQKLPEGSNFCGQCGTPVLKEWY